MDAQECFKHKIRRPLFSKETCTLPAFHDYVTLQKNQHYIWQLEGVVRTDPNIPHDHFLVRYHKDALITSNGIGIVKRV